MSSIQNLSLKARNLIVHLATGKMYWKEPETLKPNILPMASNLRRNNLVILSSD